MAPFGNFMYSAMLPESEDFTYQLNNPTHEPALHTLCALVPSVHMVWNTYT